MLTMFILVFQIAFVMVHARLKKYTLFLNRAHVFWRKVTKVEHLLIVLFIFFWLARSTTRVGPYSHDMGSIMTATTITSKFHTYTPSTWTGKSRGFELKTSTKITLHITTLTNCIAPKNFVTLYIASIFHDKLFKYFFF